MFRGLNFRKSQSRHYLFEGYRLIGIVFFEKDVPLADLKPLYTNAQSYFIPIMGMNVHVRDEGSATDSIPLILLHGMSSSLNTWDSVAYFLKENLYYLIRR